MLVEMTLRHYGRLSPDGRRTIMLATLFRTHYVWTHKYTMLRSSVGRMKNRHVLLVRRRSATNQHEKDGLACSATRTATLYTFTLCVEQKKNWHWPNHGISQWSHWYDSTRTGCHVLPVDFAGMPDHRVIGVGLSVRLAYLLLSFDMGHFEQFAVKRQFLSTSTGLMTWTNFQLLAGHGKPKLEMRIFSCIALGIVLYIYVRPTATTEKFFGLVVSTGGAKRWRIFVSVLE